MMKLSIRRSQSPLVAALHLVALLLLSLHLYVWMLPPTPTPLPEPGSAEAAWWGLWPITAVPAWAVVGGALAVLASIFAAWWPPLQSPRLPACDRCAVPILAAVSLLLAVSFFLFPIVHTRWGDAYLLSRAVAWPDPTLRLTFSWQAPLDVFLHARVWLALYEPLGWEDDAAPVYRLLSPIAGLIYLLLLLALARERRPGPPWLTYGLLATLGLMQLFYGYVENYSFAAAGVLAYLWLGLRVLADSSPLWLAAGVLAITNAIHPSTIVLIPSLLWVGWQATSTQAGRNFSLRSAVMQIGLPLVLVAVGVLLLMESGGHGIDALLTSDRPGGGDASPFVPLAVVQTPWQHYTMFSWPHLRDLINQGLLVAPVVLPALFVVGSAWLLGGAGEHSAAAVRFLLLAAACYLLFVVVWNPDYGGQRDWDLFSLSALPAALLLAAAAPAVLERRPLLRAFVPLILLQALHTAAWIYQNRQPWSWP